MCGRIYATFTEEELALRYLRRKPVEIPPLVPHFNGAPTQKFPIIRALSEDAPRGEKQITWMQWQLIPRWEKEFKTKLSTINAKSETVFQSKLFHTSIRKRRCILPVSGFFEWKSFDKGPKRAFAIHGTNEKILSLAAIWDSWRAPGSSPSPPSPEDPEGSERLSFAILTTQANSLMAGIHDRMPVILSPEEEDDWLNPKLVEETKIAKFLRPCPSQTLRAYEVSTLVNSPRNNRPEILEPILMSPSFEN